MSLFKENPKVLVLGAHPDDELGCAGAILKFMGQGATVYHYFFSKCIESMIALKLEPDQLLVECNQSRKVLGIQESHCGNFDFPVRKFPEFRQEILESMVQLKKQINPDVVFVPNRHDIHQDHNVIYMEALRTFKHCTVLGYELPWNTMTMDHDCLVKITQDQLDTKIKALRSYESQKSRQYANETFFISLARVRGVQASTELAECFQVIRLQL